MITAAKVWFLVTGAAIQLGLPIVFGSAELFGVFKIVTEAISLINMVMIVGTLQAVSKLVSEKPDHADHLVKLAIKMQFMLGIPIAALYALGSPWIAESFNDPTLTNLLRLSSLIILFYAFYAIFIGFLNGMKEFVHQAMFDIIFATLKLCGIMGLVALGFGVFGAVSGFVGAAGIVCVLSALWVFRYMRKHDWNTDELVDEKERIKRLFAYLFLVMAYTFALNALMRADLFMLKSVAAGVPESLVGAESLFKTMSDKFAGFYGAVLNVARIPYQGVIAVTFVIFPLISEATFNDDHETTKKYIQTTFRYCMLLIASVALVLVFNSDSLIAGLYSADYQAASSALAILSVSIIFFALYYVAATIIIGSGHPLAAVVITGISLVVTAFANYLLVNGVHAEVMPTLALGTGAMSDAGTAQALVGNAVTSAQNDLALAGPYLLSAPTYMRAAAIATTIAMVTGCLTAIGYLWKTFGALPPLPTLVRILIGTAVLYGLDMLIPTPVEWVAEWGKLKFLGLVLGKMTLMGIVFLIVLAVTKEFTSEDLAKVRKVIGR